MLWNNSSDPQLITFITFSKEGTDQNGMAAAVEVLFHLFLMIVSNISCVALVSYFLTTLPTKRNLFTFFDIVLVLVLTANVDISVLTISFGVDSSFPISFLLCHLFSSIFCSWLFLGRYTHT